MFSRIKQETTRGLLTRITKGADSPKTYGQALVNNGFIGLGQSIIDEANWEIAEDLAKNTGDLDNVANKIADQLQSITDTINARKELK